MKSKNKLEISKHGKILIGLLLFTTILFAYQNIYLVQVQTEEFTTVYVAVKDIEKNTTIDSSLFTPIRIPVGGQIEGAVTNLDNYVGKAVRGTMYAGEMLVENRLGPANYEGDFLAEIKVESILPLQDNDNIRIFSRIINANRDVTTVDVNVLFESKKVYTMASVLGVPPTTENANRFYLRLTQHELLLYQEALAKGSLIAAKDMSGNGDMPEVADTPEVVDMPEENPILPEDVPDAAVEDGTSTGGMEFIPTPYQVKENDTPESIATAYGYDSVEDMLEKNVFTLEAIRPNAIIPIKRNGGE